MSFSEFSKMFDTKLAAARRVAVAATEQRRNELDRLARFAAEHGHSIETDYAADCVRVGIEWINSSQGTRGTEWLTARNINELRDVLGY